MIVDSEPWFSLIGDARTWVQQNQENLKLGESLECQVVIFGQKQNWNYWKLVMFG